MATQKRRILVVEDDHKTAELVRLYLERDGHQVLTAYDGLEGLELARDGSPDLVVLDLLLPGINGMDVCRKLRQESDVPIIMLTAMSTEQDKLEGLDLGAGDSEAARRRDARAGRQGSGPQRRAGHPRL